jgi:uncharacterized protein (TIGR03083 family)
MDRTQRLAALRRERAQLVDYLKALTPVEWEAPSAADGWTVRDVVAHLGATTLSLLGPGMRQVLTASSAEAFNDDQVEKRSSWPVEKVVSEFIRTSAMATHMLRFTTRRPLASVRVPIAELGSYPMGLTPSLLIFDWHLHLRHDIAPAIGKPAPATDSERMAAVLEWMFAGMEQMNRNSMNWVKEPLSIELTGLAGGCWRIDPASGAGLRVSPCADGSATEIQIQGSADQFPSWATNRTSWRTADLTLSGDTEYAIRFLDSLNIV